MNSLFLSRCSHHKTVSAFGLRYGTFRKKGRLCQQHVHVFRSTCHLSGDNNPEITSISHADASSIFSRRTSRTWLSVESCLELYHNDRGSKVKFVDGSWYHKSKRSGRDDFERGPRIPGSIYFDMDDICCSQELFPDRNPTGLSHMMPPSQLFAAAMDNAGIVNQDHVIIYSRDAESYFLPRIWFTFYALGHGPVHIMEGSLRDWVAAGGPIDADPAQVTRAQDLMQRQGSVTVLNGGYQAKEPTNVVSFQEIKDIVGTPSDPSRGRNATTIILDARGSSFAASGHIPGAVNVPYSSLATSSPSRRQPAFKSADDLQNLFEKAVGVSDLAEISHQQVICTCGSGVSACSLFLALKEIGHKNMDNVFVFDGSWQEWDSCANLPKVLPPRNEDASSS